MATPTVREALAGGANAGSSVTLVTGAGTAVDDLLVAWQGNDFYTAAGLTTPTGTSGTWTLRATGDHGADNPHLKIWTRLVTVAGAQTVTIGPVSNEEVIGHVLVLSGVDTAAFTDGAAGSDGDAAAWLAPSVSPASSDALLCCGVQGGELSGAGPITHPSGMTERTDTNAASVCCGSTATLALTSSGATGTKSFTPPSSAAYASASIAIKGASDSYAGPYTGPAPGRISPTGRWRPQPYSFDAGITYGQSPAGSVTPTGVLTLLTGKALAGSSAPTGSPAKLVDKPLAGSTTSAGGLAKQVNKALTGSVTPSSVLTSVRVVLMAFAGTVTATGTLAKNVSKALAGSSTPTGSLVRLIAKAFAGSATGAAALAKLTAKALAGSVTASGALSSTRMILRSFAGAVTPAGSLTRMTTKALTGSATPTGSLTRVAAKALAGAVAAVGALAKLVAKPFAGSSTPTSSLTAAPPVTDVNATSTPTVTALRTAASAVTAGRTSTPSVAHSATTSTAAVSATYTSTAAVSATATSTPSVSDG